MTQVQLLNPVSAARVKQAPATEAAAEPTMEKAPVFAGETAQTVMPNASPNLMKVYFGALTKAQRSALNSANEIASTAIDATQFKKEVEIIDWNQYLERVFEQPQIACNSYQRLYDMIEADGKVDTGKMDGKHDKIYSYNFFTDPSNGENSITGMDVPLHKLVKSLEAAAKGHDLKSRFFMFEGPVGTAKSTIMTLLKRGEEDWSKSDKGALYSLFWDNIPEEVATSPALQLSKHPDTGRFFYEEPMHDDPLRVIPEGKRKALQSELNKNFDKMSGGHAPYHINIDGGLSPASDLIRQKLLEYYSEHPEPGKTVMQSVLQHVKAKRMILDETKRIGIATYMPKDPKNQDSTELNGDIDYSKLPMYGDPNHPLVQAYKGEFCVANRGIMEFVEILKLQREFLYDLLTASQERRIKPKNGTLIPIDMAIFGHTNMEELDEKKKDGKMKALFNRAVRIRVPYLLDPALEKKIYEKGFVKRCQEAGISIAPHAIEAAAEWAVLCRKDPEISKGAESAASGQGDAGRVYGLYGTSPRFLQGVFSYVAVHSAVKDNNAVSPFTVLRTIEEQLLDDGILDDKNLPHYMKYLNYMKARVTEQVKQDVFDAFMQDNDLLRRYYRYYVKQLSTWSKDEGGSDEQFMRRVEDKMKAPVNSVEKREYRDGLLRRFDALDNGPMIVEWDVLEKDDNLRKALAEVMFEDMKNKLKAAPEDAVVKALVQNKGYDEASAREVVEHLSTEGGIV